MKSSNSTWLWWLLASALAVRAAVFPFAVHYDGDTLVRVMGALEWSRAPYWISHADSNTWVFGPLPFYIHGLGLMLWDNVAVMPRLVSLLFGVLAILPLFWLVRDLFGQRAALFASISLCLYTLHVRYSVTGASEAVSSFFLLLMLWLVFRAYRSGKRSDTIGAALAANLAIMARYENVVWMLVLSVLLLVTQPGLAGIRFVGAPGRWRWGPAILFGLLGLAYFATRLYGDWSAHGDPLHSLSVSRSHFEAMQDRAIAERGFLKHHLYTTLFYPGVTAVSLSPLLGLTALAGWWVSLRKRIHPGYAVFGAAVLVLYILQATVIKNLATFARYSMSLGLVALPLVGVGWEWITERASGKYRTFLSTALVLLALINLTALAYLGVEGTGSGLKDRLSSVSPISRWPVYFEQAVGWIEQSVKPGDKLLIDDFKAESGPFVLHTTLPREEIKAHWKTNDEIMPYLQAEKPKYVLFSPDGRLKAVLPLVATDSVQMSGQMQFTRLQSNRRYTLYEITHP